MGCGASKPQGGSADAKAKDGNAAAKPDDKKQAKDETKDYAAKMQFLAKVPLMKRLPKDQHPLVAGVCVSADFKQGATVIKQGDPGDEFFVIKAGEANVMVDTPDSKEPKKVAKLKAGDYFGENALLRDEPRTATIVASTALTTFKITRAKFQELGLQDKLQFANRRAVGAGDVKKAAAKEPSPKTEDDKLLIQNALKSNENLQTMVKLDDARVQSLIDIAWKEEVSEGQELIKEGDLEADFFYIVAEGSFDIRITSDSEAADPQGGPQSAENLSSGGEAKVVTCVGKGGSFGELALLYLVPRSASVKATQKGVVWVIDRSNFKNILMQVSAEKIAVYIKYLENVSILDPLINEEKKAVAKALVEMHFTKGEVIVSVGEQGNTFYILYDGEVEIIKDDQVVGKLEASPLHGTSQIFGEKALLENDVRQATVKVISDTAKMLVLDRDSFNMLLGPLKDIIEIKGKTDGARTSMVQTGKGPMMQQKPADTAKVKILRKDLVRIGLLGCGGFGTVELWEHKGTSDTYALKGLSKGYIVKTGMKESVMNEKNILIMTNCPFIIKLHETYNGSQSLYFLLEPALGGELYATYNRKGLHGSEKHARFYCAGTIYAFEHLHERRVIYRDLKPENLLLTELGHIKLTDMGLAKFVIGKTFTTCGTPDYFAPELIASQGHTNAVDWWTLGVLLFELMSGHPPFESAYPMQIYSKVMKGIQKIAMPPKCQGLCGELIKALLKNDPADRLPVRPGGIDNLRAHKWFEGFDWTAMKTNAVDPPYKPVVKSRKDLANFSARREDIPPQIQYSDDNSGWDKEFATA
jgi:CRP-like cAMP-binding protein